MEEIQEQETSFEPNVKFENSEDVSQEQEGQVNDVTPSEQLILGKFKSVDELTKAYEKLERRQGLQSQEIGELRKTSNLIEKIKGAWEEQNSLFGKQDELKAVSEKYNDYFKDENFRNLYKEAYLALGSNLDSDKLVNLIENYVESRIYDLEKSKSAKNETEKAISSMTFSKNKTNSITPPCKSLDEMTPKEVDDLLERLI